MFKAKNAKGSQKIAAHCVNKDVESLPSNINEWLDSGVFAERYMYYSKIAKQSYIGFCECGADDIELSSAKSGKMIQCPKCGKTVKLKHDIYSHKAEDRDFFIYAQDTSQGWMQRLFIAYKKVTYSPYNKPHITVEYSYREEQRDHLSLDYDYHKFHKSTNYLTGDGLTWVPGRAHKHGCGYNGWLLEDAQLNIYSNNLAKVFSNSKFKYINLVELVNNVKGNLFWWLDEFYQYPQLEYITKLKLYRLAVDFYGCSAYSYISRAIYKNGTSIKAICGLETKEDIKYARDNNLGALEIQAYNHVKKWRNVKPSIQAIEFMKKLIYRCGNDFKYSFISNEKLFQYYLTQKDKYSISDFISDYRDYISNAIYLGMNTNDTKVKKPRDLKYCHDVCYAQAARRRKEEELRKQRCNKRKATKLYKKYKEMFEYYLGKYALIAPNNANEVIKEGKALSHCVGDYIPSIARGTCVILFLRKAAEINKPFCTVEIDPDNCRLVQCRGFKNERAPEDAKKWMDKVIKILQKKKQKELQSIANKKAS